MTRCDAEFAELRHDGHIDPLGAATVPVEWSSFPAAREVAAFAILRAQEDTKHVGARRRTSSSLSEMAPSTMTAPTSSPLRVAAMMVCSVPPSRITPLMGSPVLRKGRIVGRSSSPLSGGGFAYIELDRHINERRPCGQSRVPGVSSWGRRQRTAAASTASTSDSPGYLHSCVVFQFMFAAWASRGKPARGGERIDAMYKVDRVNGGTFASVFKAIKTCSIRNPGTGFATSVRQKKDLVARPPWRTRR